MGKVVNIHQAKTHLSKLLKEIEGGKEIIIAKSGKPIAKLVPLDHRSPRVPGIAKGEVGLEILDPLPDSDLDGWNQ